MKINPKDIRFEVFSGHGPGGANRNKCQKCVRAIHIPTGIKAVATKERSLPQNKKAAMESLQEKLDQFIKDKKDLSLQKAYEAKSDATFGSQIRTYRMCGNDQGVINHKNGKRASIHDILIKGQIELLEDRP